ncbi:MAG: hypothetical protein ACK4HW_03820 [Roseinatronobacter sp.]
MLQILASLTLLLLQAFGAAAQTVTVPVRTGEHSKFTRVVIPLSPDSIWHFEQNGREATLTVTDALFNFDITQSFTRIPRTRLRSLKARQGILELYLGCDCKIRAAQDMPQLVVLDILDPEKNPETVSESPTTFPPSSILTLAATAGQTAARALQQPHQNILASEALLPLRLLRPDSDQSVSDVLHTVSDFEGTNLVAALGKEISAAVAHGLLKPETHRKSELFDRNASFERAPMYSPQDLTGPLSHIEVGNSIARARPNNSNSLTATAHGNCPSPELLSPSSWFQDAPPLARLSPAEILTLHDEIDPFELLNAARALIYWGFGKEARLIINLDNNMASEQHLLKEISYLVDLEQTPSSDLTLVSACSPSAAFWAMISLLPDELSSDFPIELAITGALDLPEPLRSHLGSYIIRNLRDRYLSEKINILKEAMSNSIIIQSSLEIDDYNHGSAGIANVDIFESKSTIPQIPEIIHQLRAAERRGFKITEDLKSEALGLAFVTRNTENSADIISGILRSALQSGDFEFALDALAEVSSGLSSYARQTLRNLILHSVAEDADDMAFLRIIYSQDLIGEPPDASTARAIAQRLELLGFDGFARELRAVLPTADERSSVLSPYLDPPAGETKMRDLSDNTIRPFNLPENDAHSAVLSSGPTATAGQNLDSTGPLVPSDSRQNLASAPKTKSETMSLDMAAEEFRVFPQDQPDRDLSENDAARAGAASNLSVQLIQSSMTAGIDELIDVGSDANGARVPQTEPDINDASAAPSGPARDQATIGAGYAAVSTSSELRARIAASLLRPE